jgi:hypothetical protein
MRCSKNLNRCLVNNFALGENTGSPLFFCHIIFPFVNAGETDIGANIWNYKMWVQQDVTYMRFSNAAIKNQIGSSIPADLRTAIAAALAVQDGMTAEYLIALGWRIKHVKRCLFEHTPNPYQCKRLGMLFLNSPLRSELGCISQEHARALGASSVDVHWQSGDRPDYANYAGDMLQTKTAEAYRY